MIWLALHTDSCARSMIWLALHTARQSNKTIKYFACLDWLNIEINYTWRMPMILIINVMNIEETL